MGISIEYATVGGKAHVDARFELLPVLELIGMATLGSGLNS